MYRILIGITIVVYSVVIPAQAVAQFCVPGVTGTKRFEYDPGTDVLPLPFQAGLAAAQQCGTLGVEYFGFTETLSFDVGNSTASSTLSFDGIAAVNDAVNAMDDFWDIPPQFSIENCPPIVSEMPILGIGGNINLYAFHIGAGGYMRWTVQATVTACDTIRVTSPEATLLEVPIKIAGTIVAGESFGEQPKTSARGRLHLSGFFAAGTLGPFEVEVESVSLIPERASIIEEGFMYVNVPAGTSEFDYEIVAEFEAEASAKGTGFFGAVAGASTIGVVFPDTIRVGNFRGVGGTPLPVGIVIESALNGMQYNSDYQIVLGDLDGDGSVTLDDFSIMAGCAGGPGVSVPPVACLPDDFDAADLDHDGDVDVRDFSLFQQTFGRGQ